MSASTHTDFSAWRRVRGAVLAITAIWMISGCASTRPVKLTVHSDPPGGYVLMQLQDLAGANPDWIYLGNTPLVTVRELNLGELRSAKAVSLKVMKEGFFDQTKEWGGKLFVREYKEKGLIYWNPRLVSGGNK